jgi:hypothetical protein
MEANKNFAKWLSCGIQISGTFGLHHVSPWMKLSDNPTTAHHTHSISAANHFNKPVFIPGKSDILARSS